MHKKINLPEKGSAKAKGKRGYEHLWETVLKGTDKRDQKKKKEEERAEEERTGARAVPVRRDLAG